LIDEENLIYHFLMIDFDGDQRKHQLFCDVWYKARAGFNVKIQSDSSREMLR
jgi:hypothetical protein